ncbi:hypothetical protein [Photobacterium nomapromontoriensis]|uniref:hypothetical protein n=1 Tax=Photobacterium nomapromontoriensis TaxID=2910237 RepID=UPI003D0F92B4
MKKYFIIIIIALISMMITTIWIVPNIIKYSGIHRNTDIDFMVTNSEFSKNSHYSYTPFLEIYIIIPEKPDLEIWHAQHSQPQQMFGFRGNYYIANMDGSNARILIFNFELPELNSHDSYSARISRSNDGRYIYLNVYGKCITFDLLTRQTIDIDRCGVFSASDNKVYSYNHDNIYHIVKTDLGTGEQIKIGGKQIFDDIKVPDGKAIEPTGKFYVDVLNNYLYWDLMIRELGSVGYSYNDEEYKHIIAKFNLSNMEYLSHSNKDDLSINASCLNNYISNSHPQCYKAKLEQPIEFNLKNNDLYININSSKNSHNAIYSKKSGYRYGYSVVSPRRANGNYDYSSVSTNLYFSSNINHDLDSIDYALFLPKSITDQEYIDSFHRVREKLRIKCSKNRYSYKSCVREYNMDKIFTNDDQVNEYNQKYKNIR